MVNLRIGSISGHLFSPYLMFLGQSRRTQDPALPRACQDFIRHLEVVGFFQCKFFNVEEKREKIDA